MDKWYVADLKKMIKLNNVKADGETPVRKKGMIVLWVLVWGRPEPTLPKRSEEEMDMNINNNLCEGGDQHQVTSVLI